MKSISVIFLFIFAISFVVRAEDPTIGKGNFVVLDGWVMPRSEAKLCSKALLRCAPILAELQHNETKKQLEEARLEVKKMKASASWRYTRWIRKLSAKIQKWLN